MTARKREPARTVRIVYLVVNRLGRPIRACLTRDDARSYARMNRFSVVRCEVLETKRRGGGA